VTDGASIYYTRDGNFTLDSNGNMVTSDGMILLGYQADAAGNITTTGSVSPADTLSISVGGSTAGTATSEVTLSGNLNTDSHAYSTEIDFAGNLCSTSSEGSATTTTTAYDDKGNAYDVTVAISHPTSTVDDLGTAAGATRQWNVQITYESDGTTNTIDSTLYLVDGEWSFLGGTSTAPEVLGATFSLNGGSGANEAALVGGDQTSAISGDLFSLNLNFSDVGDTSSTTSLSGTADGSATVPTCSTTVTVYDSLGEPHTVTVAYTQMTLDSATAPSGATSEWTWKAYENGTSIGSSSTSGNTALYFDSSGAVVSSGTQALTLATTNGSTTPTSITLDSSALTQVATTSSLTVDSQNGYAAGTLSSYSISKDGTITGTYSNGESKSLGQVTLATFANDNGLVSIGSNLLEASVNSGVATVGTAGENGVGTVKSGYLESSNVDLSSELTDMIVAQRSFQANTRVITAVDTLLQEVLNLGR
jgi:flagellar hook protein FlgE